MSKYDNLKIQNAYRQVLEKLQPNLMVTHNFGGQYKAETQCSRITQFYNAIQRKAFGRDWAKQFDRPWPRAIGFREHPDTNAHYHVLVSACPALVTAIFAYGPGQWMKLARRGQLDVKQIGPGKLDPLIYCTKSATHQQAIGDVFLYTDSRAKGRN